MTLLVRLVFSSTLWAVSHTAFAEGTGGSVFGKVILAPHAILIPNRNRMYQPRGKRIDDGEDTRKKGKNVMQDVVVFVSDELPMDGQFAERSYHSSAIGKTVAMVQKNKTFIPHVLPVLIGTTVSFPNKDPIYHNVFSLTRGHKFDLGKYGRKATSKNYTFEHSGFKEPGLIQIFCDIHRHMKAYILVLENPYFTQPDSNGYFRIKGIPEGKWQIYVWHPLVKYLTEPIEVRENSPVELAPITLN